MAKIDAIEAGHYRIPLDTALSDSTHGTMTAFELITVRVCDSDGAQGVGYTYTTGHNGTAIHATLAHGIGDIVLGEDADRIEQLWSKVWWGLHYGGRGGAAVWRNHPSTSRSMISRRNAPTCLSGRCLAVTTRKCRAMLAVSTSISTPALS